MEYYLTIVTIEIFINHLVPDFLWNSMLELLAVTYLKYVE